MLYELNEYHEPVAKRFSVSNRIYLLILGAFAAMLVFATVYSAQPRIISFAQEEEMNPVAETYSAPYSDTVRLPHASKKVIGFLPSWNIAIQSKVYPEYLDQILYFGIPMDDKGNLVRTDAEGNILPDWTYFTSDYFQNIRARAKETNTKILVTIKNFDADSISSIISHPAHRKTAITELKNLIREHELDGIDLNFEYFGNYDSPTMENLNLFLTELRTEIKQEFPDAILSFDANATVIYTHNAYDMVKIGEQMDQIIIMGYDYSRPESTIAGPIAPLYENGNRPSVSRSVQSVLGRVPKEKIILGIPLYGFEWQTYTEEYGSATVPHTGAVATYRRVRDLIANRTDISISYGDITKSPWLVYNQNGLIKQIHYEDEKSILDKIDLVYEKDIAGIAFWALGYEGEYVEPWQIIKEHVRAKK